MPLQPLAPVSGGVVDPDDLVGRAREQRELVGHIASGGAYVVGDRRMGKTSLLRRTARDLRDAGHVVVIVSAETDKLATFNDALLAAVRHDSAFKKHWRSWTKAFKGEVRLGTTSNGIRLEGELSKPGQPPAETDLIELCSRAAADAGAASFVLVVDEVAQLAHFLHETDPAAGTEFLRTLRRLRQGDGSNVRVVLAGSVGLHHAIDDTTVLNDLPQVLVAALDHADAVLLARRLMLGVLGREDADAAEQVAVAVSDVPYYVQRLLAELDEDDDLAVVDWDRRVDEAIDANLWETDHYVTRLKKYYPAQHALAKAALDTIAAGGPTSVEALVREFAVRDLAPAPDEATVSDLLINLGHDHYLSYRDGQYAFVTPLLARIWTRARTRLR